MELSRELIRDYNETRQTEDPSLLCHFPWTTLNFDQWGRATACCYNRTHVLGSYPTDSIESMWFGDRARELRGYIERHQLTHGCQSCLEQIVGRNFHGTRARGADEFAAQDTLAVWGAVAGAPSTPTPALMPKVFEFEISNTCNLECVMCGGDFSSAIRKNREKLPAIRSPYDAGFVAQVASFLPFLKHAKFLGGEPMLIALYYDIWERIATDHPSLSVSITTNGTVLNERARAILERLHCRLIVSIDSFEKASYERIRINASFDETMANLDWLSTLVRSKGTSLSVAVCPMTMNWHEMPHIVDRCNARDLHVYFNTVFWPHPLGLQMLPAGELRRVHRYLRRFDFPGDTYYQQSNRGNYQGLVNQVGHWADEAERPGGSPVRATTTDSEA